MYYLQKIEKTYLQKKLSQQVKYFISQQFLNSILLQNNFLNQSLKKRYFIIFQQFFFILKNNLFIKINYQDNCIILQKQNTFFSKILNLQILIQLFLKQKKIKVSNSDNSYSQPFIKIVPMTSLSNKYNIYIRKLNGLGQKISVQDNMKIQQLKQIVRSLQSFQSAQYKKKDFNLIFKGKNITQKSNSTLKQLNVLSDCIVHLVFIQAQINELPKSSQSLNNLGSLNLNQTNSNYSSNQIDINISKPTQLALRIIFNDNEHRFLVDPSATVLEFKKKIAIKLNLIYQSIILSHLGVEMLNDKTIWDYKLPNQTLISLKFNLQQKTQKKKLESRMVNSVTFSDENNQPNTNSIELEHKKNVLNKNKLANSSKSIDSDKEQERGNQKRLTSLFGGNNVKTNMYKSDINSFGGIQGNSKAALLFTNALHQKIIETESVVSGSFSQDTSMLGCDPNSIMVVIKNEEQTKQFLFQCTKSHQMNNIKQKLLEIQNIKIPENLQISLEEDLFQSIDLNKSGCITLSQIIKKMGKQRAVFIYRVLSV